MNNAANNSDKLQWAPPVLYKEDWMNTLEGAVVEDELDNENGGGVGS